MGEHSTIEWTDATVNFWWGCTKVGPGCDHCYAEALARRLGGDHWGHGAPRRKIKGAIALIHRLDNLYSHWAADAECLRGNARAFGLPVPSVGNRRRVFVQSMSDLFDMEVELGWFDEAWHHIEDCDRLAIQVVTKRISAVEKRLAAIGRTTWPRHVGLMVTVTDQAEADRDVPRLLSLKAKLGIPWVGCSIEPMLGPIDLRVLNKHRCARGTITDWHDALAGLHFGPSQVRTERLDWIIVGGESGPRARPMHPDWARVLRDQCATTDVPFFFKQWGEWTKAIDRENDDPDWRLCYRHKFSDDGATKWLNLAGGRGFHGERFHVMRRVGKRAAGRLLDGVEHNAFPEVRR